MATGLLVIRMSRPFATKSAANWVMKKWVLAPCKNHFFQGNNMRKSQMLTDRQLRHGDSKAVGEFGELGDLDLLVLSLFT